MTFQRVAMLNSHGVLHRKFVLYSAFLLFLIVVASTGGTISKRKNCKDKKGIQENEKPCLSKGGICVKADHCPADQRAQGKGLCAKQESSGVVCCNKVPEGASCKRNGGECMGDCGKAKNFGKKDCKAGETCCLLEH